MIVTDASALVSILLFNDPRAHQARSVLDRDHHWAAPVQWQAEVFSALRGLLLGKKITEEQARFALEKMRRFHVTEFPLNKLLTQMWLMRYRMSGYDASYVALAMAQQCALVTGDKRLAKTAVEYCAVEVV